MGITKKGENSKVQRNCGIVIPQKMGFIMGMKKRSVVKIDPEIMSGTPCFAGTRVPVRTLIDYIEGGDTLDIFLEQFPTVSRAQAVAYLEESTAILEKSLLPA